MKVKANILVPLVVFVIVSCTPMPTPALVQTPATVKIATSAPSASSTPIPPTTTAAPTLIPSPTVEVKLVDLPQTKAAVDQFAAAMKTAGKQADADQIRQGLTTKEITGKDGEKYEIALTQDGYPLMIKAEEDKWSELTAKYSENVNNFAVGTSIDGWEGAQRNQNYRNTAGKYFSLLYLGGQIIPINIKNGGWDAGVDAMKLANENDEILYIHPGFYSAAETDDIRNGSLELIEEYISSRIDNFLKLVDTSYGKPTFLNFVNEASWDYKSNVGLFKDTDKPSNPFYKVYGRDWVSEVYIQIFNKAKEKGVIVGKDLLLVDNEAGMYFQGKKVDLMKNYLLTQKKLISEKINIPINEVKIGVGMQLHMSPTPDGGNYFKIPSDNDFLGALDILSQIGDIFLTESDVKGVSHEEEIKYLLHFMDIARKSGKVREMDFFQTLRFVDPYFKNGAFENGPNGLFHEDFTPSVLYYDLLKSLF